MSTAELWWTIVAVSIGTYLLRLSFIQMWQWLRIPPLLMRALDYVPAAVLAGLVMPALLRPAGSIELSFDNLRLFAGIAALAVAWYSRSMLATLAVGMVVLWLLEFVT